MKLKTTVFIFGLIQLVALGTSRADYKTDIGFSALQTTLGLPSPTGAGVKVTQVEASTVSDNLTNFPIYKPGTTLPTFANKTFSFPGSPSTAASSHATGVARLFYGNSSSIAPGISDVQIYETSAWLQTLQTPSGAAALVDRRIANHSWVGNSDTPANTGLLLRMVDRQVQRNEYIQVVSMANTNSVKSLLGNGYNVIAVGRTDGGHDKGSDSLDNVYIAGRTRPDLVAPRITTSSATPVVAAAAALLVETGHNDLGLSNGSSTVAGVGMVHNAERPETIKAALMAGAERQVANSDGSEIFDYRASGHRTDNGLDDRFGAGQIDIFNSYQIIAAGEQDSPQDGGGSSIQARGFDYDPDFGGVGGSNTMATYSFIAGADESLVASLVWNVEVAEIPNQDNSFDVTQYHLNLDLFDVTDNTIVASSNSSLDNTQNLFVNLLSGNQYQLRVTADGSEDFAWDYALAWRIGATSPVPLPAAFWLFGSALTGLLMTGRRTFG